MSIYNTYSNYWTCPNCLTRVFSGETHICGGITREKQPSAAYTYPAYIDNNALNRIADALEKLVELAEQGK